MIRNTNQIIKKVKDFCLANEFFKEGIKCIAAVSGGIDSTVMLDILLKLKDNFKMDVEIAHVDHGLRKESHLDAEFVNKLAGEKKLKFHLLKADVKTAIKKNSLTTEEAARIERYRLLKELAHKTSAERIATGHTAGDQAETLLFRIIRGTGPRGLSGIRPDVEGLIVRPILCLTRKEVENYAKEKKIIFVEDRTNKNINFTRNKIRAELIPFLEKNYNPEIIMRLSSLAQSMEKIRNILDEKVKDILSYAVIHKNSSNITIDLERLSQFKKELIPYVLLQLFNEITGKEGHLYENHIIQLMKLIKSKSGTKKILLPLEITAERRYEHLIIGKSTKQIDAYDSETFIEHEGEYEFEGQKFSVNRSSPRNVKDFSGNDFAIFDAKMLDFPFNLRHPERGEKMTIFGMKGSRLISRIFIDLKVPVHERKHAAVLVKDNDILWLAGRKRSALYPLSDKTENVIIFQIKQHNEEPALNLIQG